MIIIVNIPNLIVRIVPIHLFGKFTYDYLFINFINIVTFNGIIKMNSLILKHINEKLNDFKSIGCYKDSDEFIIENVFESDYYGNIVYNLSKNNYNIDIKHRVLLILDLIKEMIYKFYYTNSFCDKGLITFYIRNNNIMDIHFDYNCFVNKGIYLNKEINGVDFLDHNYGIWEDEFDFYNDIDEILSSLEYEENNKNLDNFIINNNKIKINNEYFIQISKKEEKLNNNNFKMIYQSKINSESKCYYPILHINNFDNSFNYKENYIIVKGPGKDHFHINKNKYKIIENCKCKNSKYSIKMVNLRLIVKMNKGYLMI